MVMLYSVQTQENVDVPRGQVKQALDSGSFLPLREMRIREPGSRVSTPIPGAMFRNALEIGFQPWEKADEYKGTGYEFAALAAGAASGISFGLSDLILEKGLDVDVGNLRKAQEEMFTLGEIGGVIGSLFIPGGAVGAAVKVGRGAKALKIARGMTIAPRQVARLGGATAEAVEGQALKWLAGAAAPESAGFLAKAAAKAAGIGAGGAIEGAIYGVGRGVSDIAFSEKALGDVEAVGEALVAHVGPTMFWAGTAGAAFGGLASLTGSATQGLTRKIIGRLEEAAGNNRVGLTAFAEEHTLKALGMTNTGAKAYRKNKPDVFKTLQDEALVPPGVSKPELVAGIVAAVEKHGTLIGTHVEGFDTFIADNAPQVMQRLGFITQEVKKLKKLIKRRKSQGVKSAALKPTREKLAVFEREAATISKHVNVPWMPTVIQRLENKLRRPPPGVKSTLDIGLFWQRVDRAAREAIKDFQGDFRGDLALTFQEAHSLKSKFGQMGYKFGRSLNPADKTMAGGFRAIEGEMRREFQRARTALIKQTPKLSSEPGFTEALGESVW